MPAKNKNRQGPAQGQGKAQPQRDLEEENDEENDLDMLDENELDDDDDDHDGELFWNLTVNPDEDAVLEEPPNPDALIHITHACFGEQVNKNSRTILYCSTPSLEEPVPICILTEGSHETHQLNLKFGSPASFSVKGRQPSTVYLSGYLESDLPPMGDMDDMDDMDDDIEDMDENEIDMDDEENEAQLRAQLRAQSRKRGAPEDIQNEEPTTKKRKIEPGTKKADESKKTPETTKPKNANKGQSPQQTQAKQTPAKQTPAKQTPAKQTPAQQTPEKTDTTQTSTPETKTLSKKQAKKQKKLLQQQEQGKNDDKSKADNEGKTNNTTTTTTPSESATEKANESTTKNENKQQETTEQTKSQKPNEQKKLTNGIEIKDIKVGTGATVENGQTLYLHYVGQLEDKTVFEKHLTGSGYEFKLGSQDAPVQGWNIGIKGMKVGGKRRITIPPKSAYGEQGNEEKKIPANATVVFTIEIKDAK